MTHRLLTFACAIASAVTAALAWTEEPVARLLPGPPGLCSYTFRNQFAKDVPGTLDAVKSLGITDLELSIATAPASSSCT